MEENFWLRIIMETIMWINLLIHLFIVLAVSFTFKEPILFILTDESRFNSHD